MMTLEDMAPRFGPDPPSSASTRSSRFAFAPTGRTHRIGWASN